MSMCECSACGENFGGEKLFDEHRVGKHGVNRHCLTAIEMKARGWTQDSRGRWRHTSHAPMPEKLKGVGQSAARTDGPRR